MKIMLLIILFIIYFIYKFNNRESYFSTYSFDVAAFSQRDNPKKLKEIAQLYGLSGQGNISFEYEPNNPNDSNAIKVLFNSFGEIGYVPRNQNIGLKKYLKYNLNHCIFWELKEYISYDYDKEIIFYYMTINIKSKIKNNEN